MAAIPTAEVATAGEGVAAAGKTTVKAAPAAMPASAATSVPPTMRERSPGEKGNSGSADERKNPRLSPRAHGRTNLPAKHNPFVLGVPAKPWHC
jgi:hypothetical protein